MEALLKLGIMRLQECGSLKLRAIYYLAISITQALVLVESIIVDLEGGGGKVVVVGVLITNFICPNDALHEMETFVCRL